MPENNKSNNMMSQEGKIFSGAKKSPIMTGVVVSDKMDKTIIVRIESVTRHPVYKKVIRHARKIKAHDEKNVAKIGDVVKIAETRPLSKDKRWRFMGVVEKSNNEPVS